MPGDGDRGRRLGGRSRGRPAPQRRAAVGAEPAGLGVPVSRTSYKPADMDGSSCRGCPVGIGAYGSGKPSTRLEVDGSRNLCGPDLRGQQRRALTARIVTARTSRPRRGRADARRPRRRSRRAPRARRGAARRRRRPSACALAEQLPKQLHGRFPLTRNRPARGAGRTLDAHTWPTRTSSQRPWPPDSFHHAPRVTVRRPPATSCPGRRPHAPPPHCDDDRA